ncbi:MAG: hypothetical protein MZV70_13455 [Desulfobacterales bacterium]|nr:hypothetical protein [Desulfobacterales bacterium]
MIQPLEHISRIQPYVPGKPIRELERELGLQGSIKLASNENPSALPPGRSRRFKTSWRIRASSTFTRKEAATILKTRCA